MTTTNKILCIVFITAASCNTNSGTNGSNPATQRDTTTTIAATKTNADSNAAKANDSIIHAKHNLVKIDNLDCPVCRKTVVGGYEDTSTYLCKLIGFDSKLCKDAFTKNPSAYKIKYK